MHGFIKYFVFFRTIISYVRLYRVNFWKSSQGKDDVYSPFHTACWSRKIARKLPECFLCERKHVPGLIPGLIPGWDLVTLPGSVPERALCEQKPDQCRNECVVVMTHFIVRQFYRLFWRQIKVHTTKNV